MPEILKLQIPEGQPSSYILEIGELLKRLGLQPTVYLSEGTINHGWIVRDEQMENSRILVIGPPLGEVILQSAESSGYLDKNKFVKAQDVTKTLKGKGVPAIQFFDSGVISTNSLTFAWGIEAVAEGQPLSKFWSGMTEEKKLAVTVQIGRIMGQYQSIAEVEGLSNKNNASEWYLERLNGLLTDAINLKIFSQQEAINIFDIFKKIMAKAQPSNYMGLIHGDLFQPNVFVKEIEN